MYIYKVNVAWTLYLLLLALSSARSREIQSSDNDDGNNGSLSSSLFDGQNAGTTTGEAAGSIQDNKEQSSDSPRNGDNPLKGNSSDRQGDNETESSEDANNENQSDDSTISGDSATTENSTSTNATEKTTTSSEKPTEKPTDGGSSTPSETESPTYTKYNDTTSFKGGMNKWDFEGEWGKYNLENMEESSRPIPDLQTSSDHVILYSKMKAAASLRKQFPPLHNATLYLTHYIQISPDVNLTGTVFCDTGNRSIFNLTEKELADQNLNWATNDFVIGSCSTPFTILISLQSSESSLWAVDTITIYGWRMSGEENSTVTTELTTAVSPPNNVTNSGNSTTSQPSDDTTTSGTESPKPSNGTDDNDSGTNESLKDIAHIATAIWDAFYVFLALFCACLVALIIMIVKQRCRDDPMPAAMTTYSPRTSSYQLGKPRDNPAYQTDSV